MKIKSKRFACMSAVFFCIVVNAANYTQEEYFGMVLPGDVLSFTVTPPGTVLTGQVINPGGFTWVGGPATWNGTVPPDPAAVHNGLFDGTWSRGGGNGHGGGKPLTWVASTIAEHQRVDITKYTERMLVEGKFYFEAEGTPEISGEKYTWSISGTGDGKYKPKTSTSGETEFNATGTTAPGAPSTIKVEYNESEDCKPVTITKGKFAELGGETLNNDIQQISKFLYRSDILLKKDDKKDLFDATFEYFILDQEQELISYSQKGGAKLYVREKLNNYFSAFKQPPHEYTKQWSITAINFVDKIAFTDFSIAAIRKKHEKHLRLGQTVLKANLDWIAIVDKIKKHEETLFNHNLFAKVTTITRDPDTGKILELGLGCGYQIVDAL